MDEQQIVDGIVIKKGRHRKKQLYNLIREQVEFYFSDSSLSKDRYLAKLVKEDPYVDLSIFLQFNKIRNLTTDIKHVRRALEQSKLLELSEDNTKVCRKIPVKFKNNEDDCTIYVERLPVDTEHVWLKSIFSKFGDVDYISIPRYKQNKMIKGFAFVEFSTPEAAKQVLEYFESIGCKLPTTMLPEQLASITSFDEPKQINIQTETKIEVECSPENNEKNPENIEKTPETQPEEKEIEEKEIKKGKKRQASIEDSSVEPEIETKKSKMEIQEYTDSENQDMKIDENGKKKKRKRKKSHKNTLDLQQIGLKILSKKEWRQLRNKYLNLQKQKMRNLKDQFNKNRFANNVFYEDKKITEKQQTTPKIDIIPGTIVQFELHENFNDIKKLKNEIKSYPGVQYIDIPIGGFSGYIRFKENQNATKFCESSFNTQSMKILEGDEEKEYWQKINENRENRLKKNVGKKIRGRDKLLRKAEKELGKHIRFDD